MADEPIEEEPTVPVHDLTTPEGRRDAVVERILAAGGVINGEPIPMAHSEDPHTVVAYKIPAGSPDLTVRAQMAGIKVSTQVNATMSDLVMWSPAPQPAIEPEPWPYGYDEEGNPIPAPTPEPVYYDEEGNPIDEED